MQYISPRLKDPKKPAPRRRVVVTGAGIVTSLGLGWTVNAEGFRAGETALRPITLFSTEGQRVHTGGQVELPAELPPGLRLPPREVARLDRSSRLLLWAGAEAWAQSGWRVKGKQISTVMGTSAGGMAMGEAFFTQYRQGASASKRRQPSRVVHYQCQRPATMLREALGFSGPSTIIANACASGSNAIGHAFEAVASGRAERVLAGGYDALSQLVFAGFDSLQALSTTLPRPFDANRDGLALGEGAAALTLEPLEAAQARGARILAEITGYGAYTDAHHLTQPHPEGAAALASMRSALAQAGWQVHEVDYINAHGTGTPLNDSAEGAAFREMAANSPQPAHFMVSSTKGSIGHTLGAAGAIEGVICLMALEGQWAPPTVHNQTPDPVTAGFDLVTKPRPAPIRRVLSNSFGFGGANATIALASI